MPKRFQIFQEFPKKFAGISLMNLQNFGHNFGTRNTRKSIKPSKDSYYSLKSKKNLSSEIGLFVRLSGMMMSSDCKQNMHKLIPIMST